MAQTRNRRWMDVFAVVVTLAIGGVLLYALLPAVTAPNQQVVPALPASAADPTQTFFTIFVVMTAIGAPVTAGIVLALVLKFVSRRVPASSTVAPEIPAATKKSAAVATAERDMSPRVLLVWKVLATILVLIVAGAGLAWFASVFAQLYH